MSDSGMFDKVVELGLGMAVVQQIPQMMNAANTSASQPTPPPIPKATSYFLAINGKQYGPFTIEQSLVWCQGMAAWQQASTVAELAPLFQS